MIASLGILVSKNEELIAALQKLLMALARGQSPRGGIPSLVHDPQDRGASDTTPLFLIALALYRSVTGEKRFLQENAELALNWLAHQSPDESGLTAQQPTSDWRDEQWVWGYGLYVNTLVYAAQKLHGKEGQAADLHAMFDHLSVQKAQGGEHVHEGLALSDEPYYALWTYKIHYSARFDLPGNSLAILFGLAGTDRAGRIIDRVEAAVESMQEEGQLACDLPPCLMPFIQREDQDWMPRYDLYNRPGEYHNGGIWPFTLGFYIAALTAAGRHDLAARKLESLSKLVRAGCDPALEYGFNEWHAAADCSPRGQDWQTWSAAMYLYAVECVETGRTPFFEVVRSLRS